MLAQAVHVARLPPARIGLKLDEGIGEHALVTNPIHDRRQFNGAIGFVVGRPNLAQGEAVLVHGRIFCPATIGVKIVDVI